MVNDISLTASMRSNLLSLQNTQSLMDRTQERLSTGKKVNSAIDNPSSYYTARSLTNRASDLSALLDSMGQGIQTIQAANEGIEAVTSFVEQAKALINTARDTSGNKGLTTSGAFAVSGAAEADVTFKISVNGGAEQDITIKDIGTDTDGGEQNIETLAERLQTAIQGSGVEGAADFTVEVSEDGTDLVIKNSDPEVAFTISQGDSAVDSINGIKVVGEKLAGPTDRVSAQAQYNEILNQINQLAKDSGYKGVNLLQGEELTVTFNEGRTSKLLITGHMADVEGLGLIEGADWDNPDNVALENALDAVDNAINTLRNWAAEFGNNYSILQSREDFTEKLINVLTEGSDKLTLADMNEESANMLALQTRQQLAINSLSLASQAAQSVLQLF